MLSSSEVPKPAEFLGLHSKDFAFYILILYLIPRDEFASLWLLPANSLWPLACLPTNAWLL